MPRLEASLARVRERIEESCARSGRRPNDVRLIGVTKGLPTAAAAAAARVGLSDLGENYVQELATKRAAAPGVRWHFLGRLQRNKVVRVVDLAEVVHTLEPGRAVDRLARLVGSRPVSPECLVEVDFTGRRVGVEPGGLASFVEELREAGIAVRGLMTVAPPQGDPRPWFAELRQLRDEVSGDFPEVLELSMGMSADLEAGVEEGATMVRVGTAIFGPRPEA
jgi:pyridoxal phosphate enzyme (YggS family)